MKETDQNQAGFRKRFYYQESKLAKSLLTYILICGSVLTLLATIIQLYFSYKTDISRIDQNLKFIEKSYAPAIASSVYKVDIDQMKLQLNGILQLSDIIHAQISEPRGDDKFDLAQGDTKAHKDIIQIYPLNYQIESNVIIPLGELTVAASKAQVWSRLRDRTVVILLTNFSKMLITCLCILGIFHFFLTRHLRTINRAIVRWRPDKKSHSLELPRKRTFELARQDNELDAVVQSLNQMWQRIETDRHAIKAAQSSLKKSNERYSAYMKNSTEAIWCFDFKEFIDINLPFEEQLNLIYEQAYISECNDAYAKLAGLERKEELIGIPLAEIMPRDKPENVSVLMVVIQNQYTYTGFESIDRHPDGEERILLNNSVGIIKDGFLQRAWGTALDISKLKEVEKELKQAEQRYRTVADFTYDWEYWKGLDGQMIYVSPSCERISGYSPEDFLANEDLLDEIIIKEDSPQWQHRACNIRENTLFEPESFLYRIQRKDGEKRWIEHACQPVFDSDGNSLGIRASNRDVTKRYEAELGLKSSEANLRAYMDNTDDMICARDPEGALIFWNESFNQSCIRNFGVEASVGLKTAELLSPDQRKRLMELSKNWRDVFQGNAFEVEYDFTLPNSEKQILATKWTPIEIEKRVVWAAEITRDITEKKRAEKSLRRSEQQLRLITDSLPVFISYVDHNERYIFNNKAYLDFFNLTIDEIVSRPVNDILGPETYKHVRPHVKKALDGEQTWFEVEIPRNGINHQIESSYIPDKDQTGKVKGFFVLATDVTERKYREAELQRHREELAHVSRLTTMGELTASLAHELNQPLTAILSNAQAARRFLEHDAVDIEEVKEILDDIIGDDRRAGQVIKRLRSFLKRGEFYLTSWDINEVIQEVVTLVHSDAVIRNVSVHLDLQEELPHVLGDRIQIQQVLLNLIINGLDAMIEVHPESRNLIIKTDHDIENNVTVSVGDSGTGIQSDQMQQIFEPFHTTKADGMGMGLSINRSIIQAHQGNLWAENNQNQGASFFFTLPIASGDNIDGE